MKKLVSIFLAGCIAIGAGACGSSSSNGSDDGASTADGTENVQIQFMHMQVEEERQSAIQSTIDAFEASNPGITVEQIPVNEDDYDTKIITLGGNGSLPAVVEYNQSQATNSYANQFTNGDAVNEVMASIGEDSFYEGVVDAVRTEDGSGYVAVPMSSWVQGVWVNKAMLTEKGLEVPKTWEDILKVAEAFNNPSEKMYGIATPTGESAFTEQVFSQFALSNGANILDADQNVTIDTPEMKEAVEYYKSLTALSMPGSTGVPEVKDAFVSKRAPMALYSTYILGSADEAGFLEDLALVTPERTDEAAYGAVIGFGISAGISDEETEAAKKFVEFYLEEKNNVDWLHMSPGGMHPVLKSVSDSEAYKSNEFVAKIEYLNEDISNAMNELKYFGSVDGKNFMVAGEISNKGYIAKLINSVAVLQGDVSAELSKTQTEVEDFIK